MLLFLLILTGLILLLCMCGQEETNDPADGSTLPDEHSGSIQSVPVTEESRMTMCVMGDMMAHEPIITSANRGGDKYTFEDDFAYIAPYIQSADFAVANLETTLAGNQNGYEYAGYPNFNCPDAMVTALKNAGFDMLLTANNHSNDTGADGMLRTVQVIRQKGLLALGVTETPEEPHYLIQDIQGISVGMICYTYGVINESGTKSTNLWPVADTMNSCINVFDPDNSGAFYSEISQYISEIKEKGADTVILFIHWGKEYRLIPNAQQKTMAQKLCNLGVDVIVGSHPHVVQPIDLLTSTTDPDHKTLCIYSLGNALSNQRAERSELDTGHTEDGLMIKMSFVKYTDGSVYLDEIEVLPTWVYIRYGEVYRSYDILPLDTSVTDWKSALNIGNTNLEYAKASYQRTMDQIASGLAKVEAYLEQQRANRPK